MHLRDLGLFIARSAVGGTIAAHGFQKLFGWFGGRGIDGTAEGFAKLGFEPARQFAIASGITEGVGGALLALGAATPVAAGAVAGNMAVAASTHRPNGYFAAQGGMEYPALIGALAAALALTGPGSLSVDRLFKHRYSKTWMGIAGLAGAAGAASTLIKRREQHLASRAEQA
ncbi:MAG: DoxX family protein [Acidimicrobiales bacterium]